MSRSIGIAGQGAWGKALAHVAQQAGHRASLWTRARNDLEDDVEAIILAVPAQAVRETVTRLGRVGTAIIIAAKGIERDTGLAMAEVVRQCAPASDILVLSGPSFAADVMHSLPTAVTLACADKGKAADWARALSLPSFRIYHTDDVVGVELGGALKNVLAIACGIADGKGFGESARAALITRGFAEMVRLARQLGAREETLMGLSGLGDLLLTCSSGQSRNHGFGVAIGQGHKVQDAFRLVHGVVEGAATAAVAARLAAQHQVSMPIVDAVHAIVDKGADCGDVIQALLARPAQSEF